MAEILILLAPDSDGSVAVTVTDAGGRRDHHIAADAAAAMRQNISALTDSFESGYRPLADPVALIKLGHQLHDVFIAPADVDPAALVAEGTLIIHIISTDSGCLNLPWELLPGNDGGFLVADTRCTMRRSTRDNLPDASQQLIAPPLRVLFAACAPTDLAGLDYEKEEEAILRIAHRLGAAVHLEFAETGTFEELRDLVSEYRPHVVHLSGHASVRDGIGSFAFENERGKLDLRDAREMAEQLFAGRGVRLVFVNACQTAQAAAAGLCQTLTATGHVPLALGWGASIADDHATEFARVFFHELAAGQSVDLAVAAARRDLLARCRVRHEGVELLDASFALPQLFASDRTAAVVDQTLPPQPPARPGVSYTLLGDNIRGLREGFVGRRRLLQKTRPALRSGETTILLLTGIGGAGKSTVATRLANRYIGDGYRVVALQARRDETAQFCLRLVSELATACQRLGREADERMLLDGKRPLANRLRLAVEVLNETKILLVLDNLEALMPPPPAPCDWEIPEFAGFLRDLIAHLTGQGRAILTCRYLPPGYDSTLPHLAHEPMPDFTEADFFKYLRRHERVAQRIESGVLSNELIGDFHRKLGATPRFVEQACAILATLDPDRIAGQLESLSEPDPTTEGDELWQLQQDYFRDLFLPHLYQSLPEPWRLALSRLALVFEALPIDGVATVAGLDANDTGGFVSRCVGLSLLQCFGEADEVRTFAVYPLQREFFTASERLADEPRREAHLAAAAFFRRCLEGGGGEAFCLAIVAGLIACLHHAAEAGDYNNRIWSVDNLVWPLIGRGEYDAVLTLAEPLLRELRHPDILAIVARCLLEKGDWVESKKLACEELAERERFGDQNGEARVLHHLARIEFKEGNHRIARELLDKSLEMLREMGDKVGEAAIWHLQASIDSAEGLFAESKLTFFQSLAHNREVKNRVGEAASLNGLATILLREEDYAAARKVFEEALVIHEEIGDSPGEATTLNQIALINFFTKEYEPARLCFRKSLAIKKSIGDREGEATAWHNLSSVDLEEDRFADALRGFEQALAIRRTIGDRKGESATFLQLGGFAWKKDRREIGARLVATSCAIISTFTNVETTKNWRALADMMSVLGLEQSSVETLLREADDLYQRDRGTELVRQAFEGL